MLLFGFYLVLHWFYSLRESCHQLYLTSPPMSSRLCAYSSLSGVYSSRKSVEMETSSMHSHGWGHNDQHIPTLIFWISWLFVSHCLPYLPGPQNGVSGRSKSIDKKLFAGLFWGCFRCRVYFCTSMDWVHRAWDVCKASGLVSLL